MRRHRYTSYLRAVLTLAWGAAALAASGRLAPVLAGVLAASVTMPVVAAEPARTSYLALGDSLAWGDGASDPQTTAYVPLLADYFAGVPHGGAKSLTNLAVRGETTESFILGGQLSAAVTAISDPSTDTRVVTLALGGNDVGALLNDPSDLCLQDPTSLACQALVVEALQGVAARYPFVLGSIMAALTADDGDEQVFLMTVYNPFGGLGQPYEGPIDTVLLGSDGVIDCGAAGTDPTAAGLNDIIACTAYAFGATVVDAYAVMGDDALLLTHIGEGTLDTHPNDDGYARLAKAHRLAAE